MLKTETKRSARMTLVNRSVAALLAFIWIVGGIAGFWISVNQKHIILIIISLLAMAYGGLWIKVAQKGRKLDWLSKRSRVSKRSKEKENTENVQ